MIFGLKEMTEFAEHHEDPRVQALWRRLGESMSKNSKWCELADARRGRVEQLEAAIRAFAKNDSGKPFKWAELVLAGVTPKTAW